jgi:hypothetical protein
VLHPYTAYVNEDENPLWMTDDVALLGVRDGAFQRPDNILSDHTLVIATGMNADWTTLGSDHCDGWSVSSGPGKHYGFSFSDEIDFLYSESTKASTLWPAHGAAHAGDSCDERAGDPRRRLVCLPAARSVDFEVQARGTLAAASSAEAHHEREPGKALRPRVLGGRSGRAQSAGDSWCAERPTSDRDPQAMSLRDLAELWTTGTLAAAFPITFDRSARADLIARDLTNMCWR